MSIQPVLSSTPTRMRMPRIPESLFKILPPGVLRDVLEERKRVASTVVRDTLSLEYADKLVVRPEYKVLTTSGVDKEKPILSWFFYKEAFASALVRRVVSEANLRPGAQVLDPFGGTGTVPFVCQELGVRAVSVDLSPLPVFVANTRLKAATSDCSSVVPLLADEVKTEMANCTRRSALPDVSIWAKAFDSEVAHGLLNALSLVQRHRDNGVYPKLACDIVHLALICVAEAVSHTVKDGTSVRLREPGRRVGRAGVTKRIEDLINYFEDQVSAMILDIARHRNGLFPNTRGSAVSNESCIGDARRLSALFDPEAIDLVVTSPPYPNRYDYSSIYAIELLLGFVRDREELRSLRFSLLRSHLEAPWPNNVAGLTPAVEEVLANFCLTGMSSPRVFKMILGYFSDMHEVFDELKIVMKSGASAYFVVGNVRIEGEEIPVDLILSDMARRMGFIIKEISVARYKGTNSQQAKKFGAGRLRESIVAFTKP